MRTSRILFIGFIIITFFSSKNFLVAQSGSIYKVNYMEPGYYLIVGAFQQEKGAIEYSTSLVESGKKNARYSLYPPKNLYYVHLGKHSDIKKPAEELKKLRLEKGFEKVWVFKSKPYDRPIEPETVSETPVTDEEEPGEITEVVEVYDEPEETVEEAEPEEEFVEEKDTERTGVIDLTEDNEGEDYFLYLNVVRKADAKLVKGQVEIIDPDKLKRIKIAEAHANEFIPKSFSRTGNVEMICEIFGYKKVQHDFNISKPFSEMTEPFLSLNDTRLVVDFELERYTKGDLVTMYNVYFYKDAAIMRPESKYELNQLLEMLQENAEYEIMIYGHTNGNNAGPIITLEKGSDQYFSKSAPSVEGKGSAKKLSLERAAIIKQYLISNGISASRMKAKGYGGKKGIYKKLDPLAYKNVRVEIEILVD